ncbi:MAG: hypothetical protein VX667_07310 [Nitrospinota bacterium]|nr:hypothetical protein [Nitrospinota bacterium]
MTLPSTYDKSDVIFGVVLMGGTGILIGLVIHSGVASLFAGILGVIIGGLIGWLGGRRFLVIICLGALTGTYLGYRTGDRDIMIIAAGSGAAISGFLGAQLELFLRKK